MARQIIVKWNGKENAFTFAKVDRAKLYGRKKRLPVDTDGGECESASLDVETGILLRSGMTAQGYFVDGRWIPNKELVGLDESGKELELQPSTLGVPQDLREAGIDEVLDLRVASVYALEGDDLDAELTKAMHEEGKCFAVPFNYRADYQTECGVLVGSRDGDIFLLVGQPEQSEWASFETKAPESPADSEEDDDLDFEMF
jgi:hypothetical protein